MKIFDIENNYLRSWRNNLIVYSLFCCFITISIGTAFLFTSLGQYNIPENIAVIDYNTVECATGLKKTKIFLHYGLRKSNVVGLTEALCDDVRMKQHQGDIKKTAEDMGITTRAVYTKLKKYDINLMDYRRT